MCKIYLKYMTYILHIQLTKICAIKIYFLHKYEIHSQKYILHPFSYPVKYIFPIFHDEKLYISHIYFFAMGVLIHKETNQNLLTEVLSQKERQ